MSRQAQQAPGKKIISIFVFPTRPTFSVTGGKKGTFFRPRAKNKSALLNISAESGLAWVDRCPKWVDLTSDLILLDFFCSVCLVINS